MWPSHNVHHSNLWGGVLNTQIPGAHTMSGSGAWGFTWSTSSWGDDHIPQDLRAPGIETLKSVFNV